LKKAPKNFEPPPLKPKSIRAAAAAAAAAAADGPQKILIFEPPPMEASAYTSSRSSLHTINNAVDYLH
jgi:hypothetical protein